MKKKLYLFIFFKKYSLIFLVENYYAALFARFICGVIMGINEGIIPLYIREISPLQMNGKTVICLYFYIINYTL